MWLYDHQGRFYSAVAHREDADLLVVRTRVQVDATALQTWLRDTVKAPAEIVVYQRSDYPFRVITTMEAWAAYAAHVARQITYGNYKSHVDKVADHPEQRHAVLNQVWHANLALEQIDRPAERWDEDWDDLDDPWAEASQDPFWAPGEDLGQAYRDWLAERGLDDDLTPAERRDRKAMGL